MTVPTYVWSAVGERQDHRLRPGQRDSQGPAAFSKRQPDEPGRAVASRSPVRRPHPNAREARSPPASAEVAPPAWQGSRATRVGRPGDPRKREAQREGPSPRPKRTWLAPAPQPTPAPRQVRGPASSPSPAARPGPGKVALCPLASPGPAR